MLRHTRAPLLAAITITFALAACSEPTGPRPTPDGSSASALRIRAQGGKLGASTNPVEDATGGVGAQGGAGKGTLTPVEDGAEGIGAQGTKLGTTGGGDGNQ